MNEASSSSASSSFKFSTETTYNFEFLLSEIKRELSFEESSIKSYYIILDLALKRGYPDSQYHYFRQHLMKQNKLIWDLRNKIKELEKIIELESIERDSYYYPVYLLFEEDINTGEIDSLLA